MKEEEEEKEVIFIKPHYPTCPKCEYWTGLYGKGGKHNTACSRCGQKLKEWKD